MSDRLMDWNGKSYDLDPAELSMGEYEEIAKRGGPDGFFEMLNGLKDMRPTPWKSLFWIQDRRTNPDLSFGDYAGPTFRVILDAEKTLFDVGEAPGKGETPSEADGSDPSPTSTDTPPPSSTP